MTGKISISNTLKKYWLTTHSLMLSSGAYCAVRTPPIMATNTYKVRFFKYLLVNVFLFWKRLIGKLFFSAQKDNYILDDMVIKTSEI